MPRLPITVLAALALAVGLVAAPATAGEPAGPVAPAVEVEAPIPVLTWEDCSEEFAPGAECATAAVPLDYDAPDGETVDLDLLRMAATDPGSRIGTLFVNPGGPGGSSRYFASFFGELVPGVVSERFDVVGIDPRGVGPSAPALCRTGEPNPGYPRAFFPMNGREVDRQIEFDRWARSACRVDPDPIVNHMTTADTARDMDLIRQAVGDDQLTYYGISYGTQLGSTYAAMFPDQVRALILDGVLDPVEWTTGEGDGDTRPFSERLGSGYGAWQSLTSAFAECDRVGKRRCPIAGHSTEVWLDIVHRLHRQPFREAGQVIRYSDVVGVALGSLYDRRSIRFLMDDLRNLHRAMFGHDRLGARVWTPATARRRAGDRLVPGPYGFTSSSVTARKLWNPFAGTACADSDNPARPRTWVEAGRRADRRSPWFGRAWTWASSICASWPAVTKEDRFAGPFEATTSAPVLVVGNTYDPATPLHGARAVNRLLEGSRLLVLDGWGHGALGTGGCIGHAYSDYLVDGILPAAGTVCQPRSQLFPR